MINFLQNLPNENGFFLSVLDSGVTVDKNIGAENLAVIMEQPAGRSLTEIFTGNPVTDKVLVNNIVGPINEILGSMMENRLMHGRINPGNIFLDPVTEKVILGDCLAEPCGYSQPVVYEPLERAICHPLAKGEGNSSADFYALGVLILFLTTGKPPLNGMAATEITERLFDVGSYGLLTQGHKLPTFVAELLKGLLADRADRRWGYMQVDSWLRKKLSPTPPSLTREAMRGFTFGEKEYFSTRHLAHVFARDIASVRSSLKPADLSRWVKHSVLKPELAERFDSLPVGRRSDTAMLEDDDIARIITLLDPSGPIRSGGFALDIYGFGPFLAYGYAKGARDFIQVIGNIFTGGLLQFWLDAMETAPGHEDERYQDLPWQPRKMLSLIRKSALGFGMERVLYEMNPSLPCQSPLLGSQYVDDLAGLLQVLDKVPREKHEGTDPVDRHIAGFIAAKIDLREEIILKKLAEFPEVAQNPQIVMLALVLAAQTSAKTRVLKGLSSWIAERLMVPLQSIKSHHIRDEVIKSIRKAAREGSLQEIYKVTSNGTYLKRDNFGFKEAARYYRQLAEKIHFMSRNDNNEKLAYEYGLRYAMITSYLIAAVTFIYLLTRI